jgi:hypothetical protein
MLASASVVPAKVDAFLDVVEFRVCEDGVVRDVEEEGAPRSRLVGTSFAGVVNNVRGVTSTVRTDAIGDLVVGLNSGERQNSTLSCGVLADSMLGDSQCSIPITTVRAACTSHRRFRVPNKLEYQVCLINCLVGIPYSMNRSKLLSKRALCDRSSNMTAAFYIW